MLNQLLNSQRRSPKATILLLILCCTTFSCGRKWVKIGYLPADESIHTIINSIVVHDGNLIPFESVQNWKVISPGYLFKIYSECEIKK